MDNKLDYRKMTHELNKTALNVHGDELGFNVHYWGAMPKHLDNYLHRHSFFEVCYITEGQGYYYESNREHLLQPGTLVCSRPGQWHQIKSKEGLSLFYVAFEIDEARSQEVAIHRYLQLIHSKENVIPMADESITAQIWRMLLTLCIQDRVMSRDMIRSLAYSLLISFRGEFYSAEALEEVIDIQQMPSYLLKAKIFIEGNLTSPLSLSQLAHFLHISERHISRLFTQKVGQSFSHYVQERRVQASMKLLLETDLGINQISEESGFESVHYYTRVFRRKTGLTPGQFRKTQLSEIPFHR